MIAPQVMTPPSLTAANAPAAAAVAGMIPFIRSTRHARPAHETRRSEEQSQRRDKRDEVQDEGSPLVPSRIASAILHYNEESGETTVRVMSRDTGEIEEISPTAFARRTIAGGGANRKGMVLDMRA